MLGVDGYHPFGVEAHARRLLAERSHLTLHEEPCAPRLQTRDPAMWRRYAKRNCYASVGAQLNLAFAPTSNWCAPSALTPPRARNAPVRAPHMVAGTTVPPRTEAPRAPSARAERRSVEECIELCHQHRTCDAFTVLSRSTALEHSTKHHGQGKFGCYLRAGIDASKCLKDGRFETYVLTHGRWAG